MELYTSLTRLKMQMNDGTLPPMTGLTARARGFLDSSFTPGSGALEEHPSNGLRCPVRGCGKFFHFLGKHLSGAHKNIGGAPVVRELLDIPPSVRLMTAAAREQASRCQRVLHERNERLGQQANAASLAGRDRPRRGHRSLLTQNMQDRCEAQLRAKMRVLRQELGRVPMQADFKEKYGNGICVFIYKVYGDWEGFVRGLGYNNYRRFKRVKVG